MLQSRDESSTGSRDPVLLSFLGSVPATLTAESDAIESVILSPVALERFVQAMAPGGALTSFGRVFSPSYLNSLRWIALATSPAFDVRFSPDWLVGQEMEGAQTPTDMLVVIRSFLSLTVVETAQVLGVERPTVYAWLAGRAEPQARNRERLQRVFLVAKSWSRLSDRPLGVAVRHPNDSGKSVLNLLYEDRCQEAVHLLQVLAQRVPVRKTRVPSVRDVLAKHGLTDRIKPSMDEIDVITGKRLGSE